MVSTEIPPQPELSPGRMETARRSMAGARRGLWGFYIAGLLMASLGALLLAWRHHIAPDFIIIGTYFLAQNLGVLVGSLIAQPLLKRKGIAFGLWAGCLTAAAGLLILAGFAPPLHWAGRLAGLLIMGIGAGSVHSAASHAIAPAYELDSASTMTLAGTLYTLGGLTSALVVGGIFFAYTVPSILIFLALAPLFAFGFFVRLQMPDDPVTAQPDWRQSIADFKSPAAILFAALLFFQFGNEGAVAGWLAIYLSQRLGWSPATSLSILGLYWFVLLLGRLLGQRILPHVPHGRLLAGAVLGPMFACLILSFTDNLFGVITGTVLAAAGFALILPLVVEKIGDRFPYFHPGFFSGIFSLAMTGGLLAPASLGYFAHWLGVGVVMGLPLFGSIMVAVLLMMIWLESRLSSPSRKS
jgi:fucose permease